MGRGEGEISYFRALIISTRFKIDGDPVETKVQISYTHNTITFYGEAHDRPPNCILFFTFIFSKLWFFLFDIF